VAEFPPTPKVETAVVMEADQACIEGGVPERGKKQAVVYVEAVSVDPALTPRNDVRSEEQSRICNSG
jgi:hypothetical protein